MKFLTKKISPILLILVLNIGCSNPKNQISNNKNQVKEKPQEAKIDTSNWNVYSNTNYKYEIRYPSTGKVNSNNPENIHIIFTQQFTKGKDVGENVYVYTITVEKNPLKLSSKQWVEKLEAESSQDTLSLSELIKKREEVKINGLDGYKLEIFDFDSKEEHIYLARGDLMYCLKYTSFLPNSEEFFMPYYDIFKKMSYTFQFNRE